MTGLVAGLARLIDSPPVWTVGFMAAGWWMAEQSAPLGRALLVPGAMVMLIAFLLMLWAAVTLLNARTSVIPRGSPRALVRKGPYRFTRNPIYVGDLIMLIGWAMVLGQPLVLLLVIPLALVLTYRFIRGEEKKLDRYFTTIYRAWRAETPRWL